MLLKCEYNAVHEVKYDLDATKSSKRKQSILFLQGLNLPNGGEVKHEDCVLTLKVPITTAPDDTRKYFH